ncbi:hypothetical protein GVv1_21880 [Enterobacter pseudoroggenkampii]
MNLDLFIAHLRSFFSSEVANGFQKKAKKVRELNGGVSSFEHIEHCSARLRLRLNDKSYCEIRKDKCPFMLRICTVQGVTTSKYFLKAIFHI